MSKRIELPMALETSGIAKGAKDAERALSDLEDSVADAGSGGAKDLTKIEDELKEVQRQSEKAEKAVESVGDGGKRGFGKASEATSEFKDEALSNLSEVASSFDGSAESIGELIQGTLGGVSANIPVLGLAAAGAAAGIGLITETWSKVQEATEEAKEAAYEYAFAAGDVGSFTAQSEAIKTYYSDLEKMKTAQDIATVSGWDLKDVVKALATGDGLPGLSTAFNDGANTTTVAIGRLNELQGTLDGTKVGLDNGAVGAQLYAEELYKLAEQSGTATGEVDDLGNAIVEMPGGKQVVVNAETKQAHEDLDAIEAQALTDKTARVRFLIDSAAVDNWYSSLQRRAAQGITVRANPGGGRFWE